MMKYIVSYVMENAPDEMNFFNKFVDKGLIERLKGIVGNDFARNHIHRGDRYTAKER